MMEGGQERQRADADDLDAAVQACRVELGATHRKVPNKRIWRGFRLPGGWNPSDFPFFFDKLGRLFANP